MENEYDSEQHRYVAENVAEIVADADTIVKHFVKNRRNEGLYDERSVYLTNVRGDGPCKANIGVDPRDNGAWYDSEPHKIWFPVYAFIDGVGHGKNDMPSMPRRHTARDLVWDEYEWSVSDDDLKEIDVLPDDEREEFRDLVDIHHGVAMDEWRSEVRHRLSDTVTVYHNRRNGNKVTADVTYE